MENSNPFTKLLLTAILASGIGTTSTATIAEDTVMEKCYGVAKRGMNQCEAHNHSCEGAATTDNDPEEWIYVPQGTCEKMGGSTKKGGTAKKADNTKKAE